MLKWITLCLIGEKLGMPPLRRKVRYAPHVVSEYCLNQRFQFVMKACTSKQLL